jgi:acyl transferase domain-containing protein/aryl carrier-like protein
MRKNNNYRSIRPHQLTQQQDPIAIIGIGCRFPGAKGPEAFWKLMHDGVDAIGEVPLDRFDIDSYFDPRPGIPGKLVTRWGGFIDDIDKFDPYFFGISPREARAMDPQQRLLLEVAWEALEDGGQVIEKLSSSQTGVFVGLCSSDYGQIVDDPEEIDIYFAGGNALSVLSGRLSFILGLQGPSMTIDTACSTSLVAVHLACKSLWTGESNLALAGGVNMILSPSASFSFSQAGMLAPDGRCKFGDATANGFVRSDGVGIVVLKPFSQAQSDGDPIYALIRGSAVNNDGRSGGLLMQPSPVGQEQVLREAYKKAGIPPAMVHYVEAHGTGTGVGDPIEINALGKIFSEGRRKDHPCRIGSVKTNIGHAEGASGIAGLIKVALSLNKKSIPPSLHFKEPNPDIPWKDLPFVMQTELGPWPVESGSAIAGVSSFGISGTNAHVILEEAPENVQSKEEAVNSEKTQLLTLSAHAPEALEEMVRSYQEYIKNIEDDADCVLRDICYTASARRTHHEFRLALVTHGMTELNDQFKAYLEGERIQGLNLGQRSSIRQPKLVFVFSPTGSQWLGMGLELFQKAPAFREKIEKCDKLFKKWVSWSLIDELKANERNSRLSEVDVMQPVIFAIQVALSAHWESWGITPDMVIGHSMGEIAAAHVAGILSLEDAVRIICRRSQLVRQMVSGQGAMAVIELPVADVEEILGDKFPEVSIAACNGPTTTVVSGDFAILNKLRESLDSQGIFCQMVKVDYASHSPQMDLLRKELLDALEGIAPKSSNIPMISTVTVNPLDGPECDKHYWMKNLRETVSFYQAVDKLVSDGHNIFLEISPHPILSVSISQSLRNREKKGLILPSLRREEEEIATMQSSLGSLYTNGYPIDWTKLYPSGGKCVRLPCYLFQRERYWIVDDENVDGRVNRRPTSKLRARSLAGDHPLLGQRMPSPAHSDTYFWETELSTNLVSYLDDHRVQDSAVLPATAYLEMAIAAAADVSLNQPHIIKDVSFQKALFLPEKGKKTVQLVLTPSLPGEISFEFFSLQETNGKEQQSWTLHTSGTISTNQIGKKGALPRRESLGRIKRRCTDIIKGEQHYQLMRSCGINYGPSFQGIERIWGRPAEAIGKVRLPAIARSKVNRHHIHPALLDACLQVILGTYPRDSKPALYMPVGIEALKIAGSLSPDASYWSHAILRKGRDLTEKFIEGDIYIRDRHGNVMIEVIGLRAQRLDASLTQDTSENIEDWFYEIEWQTKKINIGKNQPELTSPPSKGTWLIFADSRGIGKSLANRLLSLGERCAMVHPGEKFKRDSESGEVEQFTINPAQRGDMKKLVKTAIGTKQPVCRGVIHLWSLDSPDPKEISLTSLQEAQNPGCFSFLHLVQSLKDAGGANVPRLWVVTSGSQDVGNNGTLVSITQSPLWGLARVTGIEHPEFQCTNIDLSPSKSNKETKMLFQELWADDGENQIAFRGGKRYVARVTRIPSDDKDRRVLVSPDDQPFKLEIAKYGILDNFVLRAIDDKKPGPGEIKIRVYAAGLNFRDVMTAMGLVPPMFDDAQDFGWECAGKIVSIGKDVKGYRPGDEVVVTARSCFSSYITIPANINNDRNKSGVGGEEFHPNVVLKPAHLSFEEAATIPIVFITSYYSLIEMARLKKGERVLIHAAAGGVGQAAVQIAQHVGAEIFATAGSPRKREFLKSQGITHVMNSRSLDFADEIMKVTNGEGIDVVLNSLAGDFIPKSLSLLRVGGRFIELGKIDIFKNSSLGLRPFDKNISFFAIDLGQLLKNKPEVTLPLFREVMKYYERGNFKPLPLKTFPISEVSSAFRYLAQAKNIGKVIVSLKEEKVWVSHTDRQPLSFRADGTYLITGGLGGLGLTIANWMVERGAKHLVLMGRSGAATDVAKKAIKKMKKAGAKIKVAKADVSDERHVAKLLKSIKKSLPPLKGIIHTAAVLDDGIILQLSQDRFKTAMAPKVSGAWILHTLTLKEDLDFFIMFSSAASLLASPGQGTYVSANAFLDSFAHYRRALGLPAQTFNWGLWSEVGMASLPVITKRLTSQGIIPFTPNQGLQLMERSMKENWVQVMLIAIDWSKVLSLFPTVSPFLSRFAKETNVAGKQPPTDEKDRKIRESLVSAEAEKRRELLEAYLQEQIAKVLRIPATRVDLHKSLMNMGLDSLMALELKNRVELSLAIDLPVTNLIKGPTIAELATELLGQLTIKSESPESSDEHSGKITDALKEIEQLSDDEARAILIEKERSLAESDAQRRIN